MDTGTGTTQWHKNFLKYYNMKWPERHCTLNEVFVLPRLQQWGRGIWTLEVSIGKTRSCLLSYKALASKISQWKKVTPNKHLVGIVFLKTVNFVTLITRLIHTVEIVLLGVCSLRETQQEMQMRLREAFYSFIKSVLWNTKLETNTRWAAIENTWQWGGSWVGKTFRGGGSCRSSQNYEWRQSMRQFQYDGLGIRGFMSYQKKKKKITGTPTFSMLKFHLVN